MTLYFNQNNVYETLVNIFVSKKNMIYLRRCIVNAPHCTDEAWKFPLSTWRYLVLTVWDRRRLNKATLVPLATQTIDKRYEIVTCTFLWNNLNYRTTTNLIEWGKLIKWLILHHIFKMLTNRFSQNNL